MTPSGPYSPPDAVAFGETVAVLRAQGALRLGKVAARGGAVMTPVNQSPPDVVAFGEPMAALRAEDVLRLGKVAAGEAP